MAVGSWLCGRVGDTYGDLSTKTAEIISIAFMPTRVLANIMGNQKYKARNISQNTMACKA